MTNNKTTALIENWKPMPAVLRGYAKDMDTNTRLIDGDIAPYLRKVADWIEALAAFEQPNECRAENGGVAHGELAVREMSVEEAEEYIYSETKRFTETSALLALAKLGTIRIVEGKQNVE